MAYYVANSYKNYDYDETKAYEKNGRLYVQASCKCDRCTKGIYVTRVENGMPIPHPNANGVCFKCGGKGIITKEIRLYSETEKAAMDRTNARNAEKKVAEQETRRIQELNDSEKNMKEWWSKNGIGKDGLIWCITGDTYAIKEKLKEMGCRFSPTLKWYSPIPLDLPVGYGMISFSFEDLYEWNPHTKMAYFYENAKEKVEKAFQQAAGPSLSEYIGEIGERIRNITVRYDSKRGFESKYYGWTNIYTFYSGDNCIVWFSTKELILEKGQVVDLTGTIVGQEEFRGVKTTKVNRCIIKPIN